MFKKNLKTILIVSPEIFFFFREVCSVSKKAVKKYTPQTRCEKIPVELCGPAGKAFHKKTVLAN